MKLKALWYCTKSDLKLYKTGDHEYTTMKEKGNVFGNVFGYEELNGKVVAMSDYEVEEVMTILNESLVNVLPSLYTTNKLSPYSFLKRSCLTADMVKKYKPRYAIHIKNLNVFKKPKSISQFFHTPDLIKYFDPIVKAPQNMCYVFDKDGNKYVLISVHPEWLCLILNGIKDVELRRKVLKEMIL